jgi:hypothetical protein
VAAAVVLLGCFGDLADSASSDWLSLCNNDTWQRLPRNNTRIDEYIVPFYCESHFHANSNPNSRDCTTDNNQYHQDGTKYNDWINSCQDVGGLIVVRDAHLYCKDKWEFHQLNYRFCLASTCTSEQINDTIEWVYFPQLRDIANAFGYSTCTVYLSPRKEIRWGLIWTGVALSVLVLFLLALGVYFVRQRKKNARPGFVPPQSNVD